MEYPEEWNELPKHERKKKIKELRREQERKSNRMKKVRNRGSSWGIVIVVLVVGVIGFTQFRFEQKVEVVSLEGKVEEFPLEGNQHVFPGASVSYDTNPPTSGSHLGQAQNWGIYSKELDDKAVVHGLEHGGIWITYKDISEDEKAILEEIGRGNSQSVILSPRTANDAKIAVVSWGKMMKLETADKVVIQKYIDTYKNQSPEKLAR